jgi:hypothetical protein
LLAERHRGVDNIAARWLNERQGDADLGSADLGQIMGTLTGQDTASLVDTLRSGPSGASEKLPPELGELLKELETLSAPEDSAPSPADLKQLREALDLPPTAE